MKEVVLVSTSGFQAEILKVGFLNQKHGITWHLLEMLILGPPQTYTSDALAVGPSLKVPCRKQSTS